MHEHVPFFSSRKYNKTTNVSVPWGLFAFFMLS